MSRAARPGPGRYQPEEVAEMVELYLSGLSSLQVAARVGCDHTTVRHNLRRLGLPVRNLREALEVRSERDRAEVRRRLSGKQPQLWR